MSSFFLRYEQRKKQIKSLLCIGLDPNPEELPAGYATASSDAEGACRDFLYEIIDATHNYTVAYKLNCAFFEALGKGGMLLFADVVTFIREKAPEVLIIADAKRGDVSHSATAYARAFFEELSCDSITLNPYMGLDCLKPFLAYAPQKSLMVLCHTSNPGASFFQHHGEPPLYLEVARHISMLNEKQPGLWLVVGATLDAKSIAKIRSVAPNVPFLMPGIGTQGGSITSCLESANTKVLLNVGRSVLYAAKRREELATVAASECEGMLQEMSASFL